MRRREVINGVRFLTFSCYRRLFLLANPRIRDLFAKELTRVREKHRFRLIAWVVMPNHVHLLIMPRPIVGTADRATLLASWSNVTDILTDLKGEFGKEVIGRWKQLRAPILDSITTSARTPRFWQPGGGFDRNIGDDHVFLQKIAYIHHNPVKNGLVEREEDWAWSSKRWYLGERDGQVPIDFEWGTWKWTPPAPWIRDACEVDMNAVRRGDFSLDQ